MVTDAVLGIGFDHVTIVVTDLDDARRFFGILGFEERATVVVEGETISKYMGVPAWKADHVTMALRGAPTHQEVQLLRFHNPPVRVDGESGSLDRSGFNHLCLRVDDLAGTLERLQAAGHHARNEPMRFHDRDLVFLQGPAGVTVELAQWLRAPESL